MEQQKLQQYITQSLQSGMQPDEISYQLAQAGWSQDAVAAAMLAVGNAIAQTPTQPQTEPQPHLSNSAGLTPSTSDIHATHQSEPALTPSPFYKRGRIKASILLMRQTFVLLWGNKRLFRYPLIGAIISMLLSAVFFAAVILTLPFLETLTGGNEEVLVYGILFFYYLIAMFVVFTYNTALTANLLDLFKGSELGYKHYLSLAWSKKKQIFTYSMITATLGVLIAFVENAIKRLGRIGRAIIFMFGFTWQLATTFSIALIADTNTGGLQAVTGSIRLFKDKWGENLIGKTSFTSIAWVIYNIAFYFLAMALYYMLNFMGVLGILAGFFALFGWFIGFFLIISIYFVPFFTLERALTTTLNTVLYHYTTSGYVPPSFSPEMIQSSVLARKAK